MKNLHFFVLLTIIALLSCIKNETVILKGHVSNNNGTLLLLSNARLPGLIDTLSLVDGKFSKILHLSRPGFRTLEFGENYREIFLMPGFSLDISFDAENFEGSYAIKGKGSTENMIFDSVYSKSNQLDFDLINDGEPEVVLAYVDSMLIVYNNRLSGLINSSEVSPIFEEYAFAEMEYGFKGLKHFRREVDQIEYERDPSNKAKLYIENENYLDIPSYLFFLLQTNDYRVDNEFVKGDSAIFLSPQRMLNAQLAVIEQFKNQSIKDFLVYEAISGFLRHNGVKNFSGFYDYFRKNNSDSMYANLLEKSYQEKLKIAPGQPAPEFIVEDMDGKKYSLQDFTGKFVYIDTWATWCGSCIKEEPYFEKLIIDYQGKEIEYLSVSLDENRKSWEDYLIKNNKGGLNLIAVADFKSDIAVGFQVRAVPTFILIDKDGKIVDANAPRPSSPEIRMVIDSLLDEN